MSVDQQNNPYAAPAARLDDSATHVRWHGGFRFRRALKWGFLTWLSTTLLIGGLGGLAGFGLGHGGIPPSFYAAFVWMLLASFTASLAFAIAAFLIGLLMRIPAHQLAGLLAPRAALGRANVDKARAVAQTRLRDPVYIADYAKLNEMSLDEVHHLVKQGRLQIFWHEGIAFVEAPAQESPAAP
jgi:hypothetical protein